MVGPVRRAERRQVGFVGEPAGDPLAELVAELPAVGFHRHLDELLGDARMQQIDVTAICRPVVIGRPFDAHDQVSVGRRCLAGSRAAASRR